MPLLTLWSTAPEQISALHLDQIVATAGDGRLRDDSECSRELREFLSQVSSEKLAEYAEYCLGSGFEGSGFVLQDVVNELGRRLDYTVTSGRYRGTSSVPGHDGLWVAPEGHEMVVEVKTTDAYRVSLDAIAGYRGRLVEQKRVGVNSCMLLVVGRQDTGELEAQVRGSRHAWDMRLISTDALIKLVKLKESTENPETGRRIRSVLTPVEYTRLDPLIDVLLTAAEDIESAVGSVAGAPPDDEEQTSSAGAAAEVASIQGKRDQILAAFARARGKKLIRTSRAVYWDAEHGFRVVCTVSKRYTRRPSETYWYAYRQSWERFLLEGADGYLVLGGTDLNVGFAIPARDLEPHLQELHSTERDDGTFYWHLNVIQRGPSAYSLPLPKSGGSLDLAPFVLALA